MFGKNPRMNSLKAQKQLLIVESELNRVQMEGDITVLVTGAHRFTDRAKSFTLIASAAAAVAAGIAAVRKPAAAGVKSSWLETLLKGAGFFSNVWLAFRPLARKQTRR